MDPADVPPADTLNVEFAYSPAPRRVELRSLQLPAGATVADALRAAGHADALEAELPPVGVWGRRCGPEQPLRDGDRVERYRALQVDPKEARRLRYRQHREMLEARARDAQARKARAPG